MKSHVFAALVMCAGCAEVALGASVVLHADLGKSGTLVSAADGYGNTLPAMTYGYLAFFGDSTTGSFDYDLAVLKFALPGTLSPTDTINSATYSLPMYNYVSSATNTIYVKVQRYASDNNTGLMSTDHPDNATLVDVGVASITNTGSGGPFLIDLTSAVAADVAAGKTYTSYLLSAVADSLGTPITAGGSQGDVYYGGFADPQYGEALTIDYTAVPEPGALTLLGLGAMGLFARKRR